MRERSRAQAARRHGQHGRAQPEWSGPSIDEEDAVRQSAIVTAGMAQPTEDCNSREQASREQSPIRRQSLLGPVEARVSKATRPMSAGRIAPVCARARRYRGRALQRNHSKCGQAATFVRDFLIGDLLRAERC